MKNSTILFISFGSAISAAIIYNEIQKRRHTPIYFLKKIAKNYNARTIPPFGIYIKKSESGNKSLLEHELVHWKQYQEKGLIKFYSDYAKEMKQFGYDKMPMEKEARKNENEYCKDNYTECVRTGQAKTVFNPNFREIT